MNMFNDDHENSLERSNAMWANVERLEQGPHRHAVSNPTLMVVPTISSYSFTKGKHYEAEPYMNGLYHVTCDKGHLRCIMLETKSPHLLFAEELPSMSVENQDIIRWHRAGQFNIVNKG
jgi:hypothetical protein